MSDVPYQIELKKNGRWTPVYGTGTPTRDDAERYVEAVTGSTGAVLRVSPNATWEEASELEDGERLYMAKQAFFQEFSRLIGRHLLRMPEGLRDDALILFSECANVYGANYPRFMREEGR